MRCRLPILNAPRGLVKLSCTVNFTSQLSHSFLLGHVVFVCFARRVALSLWHTSQGEVKGGQRPLLPKWVYCWLYVGCDIF